MLLGFRCSNHKSIKAMMTFSMVAGQDDTDEERLINFDKFRVSRSSVIYGANGHGKSNFISAINFMRNMVLESYLYKLGIPIKWEPHKLSDRKTPSEYDIQFVHNGVRYAYGFSVNDLEVLTEYLYYFPNKRQVKIFERKGKQIQRGDRFKNSFEATIKEILGENRLFLSCAGNYGDVEEVKEAFRFFQNGMAVFDDRPRVMREFFSSERDFWDYVKFVDDNPNRKEFFIKLLRSLGMDVKDIVVEKIGLEDIPRGGVHGVSAMEEWVVKTVSGKIKLVYDGFETNLLEDESKGIQRLFEISWPLINALENGTVLIFDELESSLHEHVALMLVKLFQLNEFNDSQLIFSTHNTNLLDAELFRRDQVWFAELDAERATDVYSLAAVKNVRKSENMAKGYMAGRYGAIPMCNEKILQENRKLKEDSI